MARTCDDHFANCRAYAVTILLLFSPVALGWSCTDALSNSLDAWSVAWRLVATSFSTTSPTPYDFNNLTEKMQRQRLSPEPLRFRSSFSRLAGGERSILIYVSYGDRAVGFLDMVYDPNEKVFESHSHLNDSFRGVGMGMMLYVIAAKIAREKYRSILVSSLVPFEDAAKIWARAEKNGWTKMNRRLRRPQFIPSVVDSNFDDLYSFFLSKMEGALPPIEILR